MPPPAVFLKSQRWLRQCSELSESISDTIDIEECLQRLDFPNIQAQFKDLSVTDLYTLASKRWLTDRHINSCGAYINSHVANKTFFVVDSFYVPTLRKTRTTHPTWSPRQSPPADIAVLSGTFQYLLFPIHTPGHWTLCFLDLLENTYVYVDSMNLDASPPEDLVPVLDWWLSSLRHKMCSLASCPRTFQAEQQDDSHSCGPFVMSTMAHIALSTSPWTSNQSHMHRIKWFLTFTEQSSASQPMLSSTTASSNVIDLDPIEIKQSEEPPPSHNIELPLCDIPDAPSTSGSAAGARQIAPLPSHKLFKQTQLGFIPVSREQWLLQEQHRSKKTEEIYANLREKEAAAELKKALDKKEKERLKKRTQRARKKARLQESEPGVEPTVAACEATQAMDSSDHLSVGIAELSRPHRHSKHALKQPELQNSSHTYENDEKKAKRVNWMNPFLWEMIDKAARAVGFPWSPVEIVKRLRLQLPNIFNHLSPQRISDWRDRSVTDRLKWKDKVIAATRHGNHPRGESNRQSILAEYPKVIETITRQLKRLRDLGMPLELSYIRAFMISIILLEAPELFEQRLRSGKFFRCSDQFVRTFLHEQLSWSLRRPTRAAQRTPSNVQEVLQQSFLRLACLIRDEEIPACCIVNADQTQVVYSHGCQYTWTQQGEKQVPIAGKDEMRAFTLLVGVSNDGQALPFQAIYQGSTTASLPDSSAPLYEEAKKLGFRFEPSKTKSYWATQETMRKFVEEILVPFFKAQIETNNLPPDQRCIFQIDVWSVHRSAEFRNWMGSNYPWISLQYIPGGCTGLFQACDVGIQRVVKSAMRQKALADMVNETSKAIEDGADINTFKNKTDLRTLRNRSVSWMIEGFKAINKPDLIKKAFELCAVPNTQFNLSYKSLTSPDTRRELRELKEKQPKLYAELAVWKSSAAINEDEEEKAFEHTDEADELSVADLNHLTMQATTASDLVEKLTEHDATEDTDELEFQESSDDEFESPATSSKSAESTNTQLNAQPLRRSARGPKPRIWCRWDASDFD